MTFDQLGSKPVGEGQATLDRLLEAARKAIEEHPEYTADTRIAILLDTGEDGASLYCGEGSGRDVPLVISDLIGHLQAFAEVNGVRLQVTTKTPKARLHD